LSENKLVAQSNCKAAKGRTDGQAKERAGGRARKITMCEKHQQQVGNKDTSLPVPHGQTAHAHWYPQLPSSGC